MAETLAGGAALGAPFGSAFSDLYQTVKSAVRKACMFKPLLKRLESTLDFWQSLVEQIRQLNIAAGHSEEETRGLIQKMEEGKNLVRKCSEVNWLNCCTKAYYGNKLRELDEDIKRFFQVDFQSFNARNGAEALAVLKDIQTTVNEMSKIANLGTRNGRFFFPVPPRTHGEVEDAAARERGLGARTDCSRGMPEDQVGHNVC